MTLVPNEFSPNVDRGDVLVLVFHSKGYLNLNY